jgi:hypothetical protein
LRFERPFPGWNPLHASFAITAFPFGGRSAHHINFTSWLPATPVSHHFFRHVLGCIKPKPITSKIEQLFEVCFLNLPNSIIMNEIGQGSQPTIHFRGSIILAESRNLRLPGKHLDAIEAVMTIPRLWIFYANTMPIAPPFGSICNYQQPYTLI